jgi:hypothetical protein
MDGRIQLLRERCESKNGESGEYVKRKLDSPPR